MDISSAHCLTEIFFSCLRQTTPHGGYETQTRYGSSGLTYQRPKRRRAAEDGTALPSRRVASLLNDSVERMTSRNNILPTSGQLLFAN